MSRLIGLIGLIGPQSVKILLDAFPLNAPKSGVGYYTYHLLKALSNLYKSEDEFIYFYGRRFSNEIIERPATVDAATRKTLKALFRDPYRITQPIKELIFKIGAKKINPDIYHDTNYVLLPYSGPQVVTVFDMSIKRFPETHPAGRVKFFNEYFDKRIPNANQILSISEFTKNELVEIMGISPDKITVTPLAQPENFYAPSNSQIEEFKKEHRLPDKFFLYLGNIEPRKNLITLIQAFKNFSNSNHNVKLILAGSQTWLSEPVIQEIKKLNLENSVFLPGYVNENDLPLWYASSLAFVYPSKYEGFGLPVIESMAAGSPVITSNVSSIPEVAGDAAILIPPDDIDGWASAMSAIVNSPEMRERLINSGLSRAKLFSWEKCAKMTHEVYENCLKTQN